MHKTRRDFLAGAALVLGAPAAALAQPTCTPPAPLGTMPKPWTLTDIRDLPRVSAYNYSQYKLLTDAYGAMRNLPNSDPRSLEAQQNMHAWFCSQCPGSPADIHYRWTFFVWHRAFLFFHERILGSLVKDMTLRLPYWDWENPSRRLLPATYYSGALNDTTRDLKQGQSVERTAPGFGYYDLDKVPAEMTLSFTNFGGDQSTAGDVELHPHGFVHMSVGGLNGDMGNLETAAGDPIFYAHHANVDRVWYSWEKYGAHADPPGAFRLLTFNFYDERKVYRSITADQVIPTTKIGYHYDTTIASPRFTVVRSIPLELRANAIRTTTLGRGAFAEATQGVATLSALQFSGTGAFVVEVHNGSAVQEIGRFFVVPHGKNHPMDLVPRRANLQFLVTPAVAQAIATQSATITLRQSTSRPGAAGALLSTGFSFAKPAVLQGLSVTLVR